MNTPLGLFDGAEELRDQIAGVWNGTITPEDRKQLEQRLADDDAAREYYLSCMALHAHLLWQYRGVAEERAGISDQWPVGSGQWAGAPIHPSSIPPIVIDPAPKLRTPIGSFVFSHIAAAMILGIGLLIGLAWRISLPSPGKPCAPVDYHRVVGHVTALADCHWHKMGSGVRDQGSGISEIQIPKFPNPQIPVFLGDCFHLASGLMEITYDSGAKVILEGPCTYGIDTERSGYLSVGKLTAKVEKGSGARGPGSGNANHSAHSSLLSPLFMVRTPMAVVIDLGTEFGVEVEESGLTRSHVFQGSVALRSFNGRSWAASDAPVEILHAGQSIRVERGRNSKVAITRELGQPGSFVRHIPVRSPESRVEGRSGPKGGSGLSALDPRPSYRLTDLGALGGDSSFAYAMNAAGQVVGESVVASGALHAFLYSNGKMEDLGAPHGENSGAEGINRAGHVVGWSGSNEFEGRAFLFQDGAVTDLGTLGGDAARPSDINDAGVVVGASRNSDGVERAFLFTDRAGMKDLGALGGPKAESHAVCINATGQVVGYSETDFERTHAFLYGPNAGMKDLGVLQRGDYSRGMRVNDAGQVVGFSRNDDLRCAFLHDNKTGMKNLGVLDGLSSVAVGINNRGQVVGGVEGMPDDAPIHAFLYSGGKMFDLNKSINPKRGWILVYATDINDSGQIAGYGMAPDGTMRAFMLTPIQGARD